VFHSGLRAQRSRPRSPRRWWWRPGVGWSSTSLGCRTLQVRAP